MSFIGDMFKSPKPMPPPSPAPTKVEPNLESTMLDLERQMKRANSMRKSMLSPQFNGLLQQKQSTQLFRPMLSDKLG